MKILAVPVSTLLVAAALALPAPASAAGQEATARVNPAIEADARAAMDHMAQYLGGLSAFSLVATASRDQIVDEGFKLQNNETISMVVRRPDGLRVDVAGDLGARTFVYDGKQLSMLSAQDQAYVQVKAPATLQQLLGNVLAAGIELPLIDVLHQAFSGTLLDRVRGGVLVGDATVDGVACQQLAFRQGDVDWQIWIEKGSRPLPRKILLTTRHEYGQPQFEAVLDWNTSPRLDAASFRFVPPAGAVALPFDAPIPLDYDAAGDAR